MYFPPHCLKGTTSTFSRVKKGTSFFICLPNLPNHLPLTVFIVTVKMPTASFLLDSDDFSTKFVYQTRQMAGDKELSFLFIYL